MNGTFLFLGTGASTGVPMIGCRCAVCTSPSPYNKRLRPSGLIKIGGKSFLIDAGPDFRNQALIYKIDHLDGLLLTHTHYDHMAGIDDLRPYSFRTKEPMPCLLSGDSLKTLRLRYHYLFQSQGLKCQELKEGEQEFEGVPVTCFNYVQGSMTVTGFRFGDFAYVSDIRTYDESIFTVLKGVKKLVLSALKREASRAHLSLAEAVEFAHKTGAYRTWLTHVSHHLDHDEGERHLPKEVRMGYDGLTIDF